MESCFNVAFVGYNFVVPPPPFEDRADFWKSIYFSGASKTSPSRQIDPCL